MSLVRVVEAFRAYLEDVLDPPPAMIGGAFPVIAEELPAVSISVDEVAERARGLGRLPAPVQTGALRIETSLDLANPVVTVADETVDLLSEDRQTLQLPHGGIVRADGTPTRPFAGGDLLVEVDGTPLTVVGDEPDAGEVRPDPEVGELLFGAPLPAVGTLRLGYFVGEWEVTNERYQGLLAVQPFADDVPGVEDLTRQVDEAFADGRWRGVRGLRSFTPKSFGPVVIIQAVGAGRRDSRSRTITYAFDYERVEPVVRTGGGLIGTVAIESTYGAERFEVTREGSTA